MKKFLVVCAVMMLPCFLVRAQEAEDAGRGAVLSFIPRFDAGVLYDSDEKTSSFSYGNTSFYTLFEGNISDKWSFSFQNHWLASDAWAGRNFKDAIGKPTEDLYVFNGIKTDKNGNNFCDWAYVTFSPGPFAFSLGKQMLLMGGWEYDDYDFDVNPLSASLLWNTVNCYQYAVNAAWTLPDDNSTLTLQFATNPYNSGFAYAAAWDGTYGFYGMKWSALTYKSPETDDMDFLFSLGNRFTFGDFILDATYNSRCGDPEWELSSVKGHTVVGSLAWQPLDALRVAAKGVMNRATDLEETFWTGGLEASWFPLKESENLRLQAMAGYSNGLGYALMGLTWRFDLKLW